MPLHGNGWRPNRITRFIRSFGTSMGTAQVDTDLGEGYVKAMGNPEGPHQLACELVGSRLAEWLGVSTLDFALIEIVDGDEIPFMKGGTAQAGPAFISRAEPFGIGWSGSEKELQKVANRSDISGLVVLDTWLLNCDRFSPDRRRVNYDNVFLVQNGEGKELRLVAIDFSHAFTCGGEISRRIGFIDTVRSQSLLGLFPEFQKFLDREVARAYANRLVRFPHEIAEEAVRSVPREWEIERNVQADWVRMITERAHFVGENIETMIWPQLELQELEGGTE